MPALLEFWTDYTIARFVYCMGSFYEAGTHLFYAGGYIDDNDWANAKASLIAASDDIHYACAYMHAATNSITYGLNNALYWINDNWPNGVEPAEVTMDAILSAMVGANPEQVTYFVGLSDAYRQSIWTQPFNKEYYAALARGFMLWP